MAPPLSIHSLEGEAHRALEALLTAFDAIDRALPAHRPLADAPLDLLALRFQPTIPVADAARTLARALLRSALTAESAPPDARALAPLRDALADAVAALGTLPPTKRGRHPREGARTPATTTGELLREIALEELDQSVHLGTRDADGAHVLIAEPIPPETAHVWLLGRLYDRVELDLRSSPLLSLEREASRWWFERWSAARRGSLLAAEHFSHMVREQEWSLVERETIALDVPMMTALLERPFFADIPPRQQRMARALTGSFPGIFVVHQVHERTMLLEQLPDGRRFEVHEHSDLRSPTPGAVLMGRLIPFEGHRWLRSPGALRFPSPDPLTPVLLAGGLALATEELSPAIALEAELSTYLGEATVPRTIRPSRSARDAREWLAELSDAMAEAELREIVAPEDVPPDVRAQAAARHGSAPTLYSYPVDEVLLEWTTALSKQVDAGERRR